MAKILGAGEILPPVPRRALLRDYSLLEEPAVEADEDGVGDAVEDDSDDAADSDEGGDDAADSAEASADGAAEGSHASEGADSPKS